MRKSLFFILLPLFTLLAESKIEKVGDYLSYTNIASGFIYSYYIDDIEGDNELLKSQGANFMITYALKYSVQEPRPDKSDTKSFPSGHTSASFANATYLHIRYGFETSAFAYISASIVAYTRIESKRHYFHDVLAGVVVGSLSSYYLSSKFRNFQIFPELSSNIQKITIHFNF